jgi:naphthalene 1,2-dioxygenase ferredoxin component
MTQWIDAAAAEEVWDGAGLEVRVQGTDVALFRVGERVFATAALCTHGHARLCDGFVEGGTVECPLHQGQFDLETGAALCEPVTEALRVYPVRVEKGRVLVSVG